MNETYITEGTSPAESTTETSGAEMNESTIPSDSYDQCNFDCCTNPDCQDGCCISGQCQPKQNTFDLCAEPPLKPLEDGPCGSVSYKKFQVDGNCPGETLFGGTIPGFVIETTSGSTTTEETQSTSAAASSTTSSEVVDPCDEGSCLDPEGVCQLETSCTSNPCIDQDLCDESECVPNYCGGCRAVCLISTSQVGTTTAAATATYSTEASLTSMTTSASFATNENACGQGKCLNMEGNCERQVICMTHPCDLKQCLPNQECIANFCGACDAYCLGEGTESPLSSMPSEEPSWVILIPTVQYSTSAPVGLGADVPAVDETVMLPKPSVRPCFDENGLLG
jgi:hypothetical protein